MAEPRKHEPVNAEAAAERARCAWLCQQLACRWEKSADRIREDGVAWIGFLCRRKRVDPAYERSADAIAAAAHGLRLIERGIREGWETPADESSFIFGPDSHG